MILSAISALVFLFATNVGLLLAGRVISGLSAGLLQVQQRQRLLI